VSRVWAAAAAAAGWARKVFYRDLFRHLDKDDAVWPPHVAIALCVAGRVNSLGSLWAFRRSFGSIAMGSEATWDADQ